ncbi:MAG: hypothetical protein ACLP5H_34200 [Desulfomonilaceae bacterium]
MKKKKKKVQRHLSEKKAKLCNFGFELKPRCGVGQYQVDIREAPELRAAITDGVFPPYTYAFINEDTVVFDLCLVCHMEQGYTPQDYERRFEAIGVTRANWKELEEEAELTGANDKVERQIREERQQLVRQLINEGFPVDMDIKGQIRDS